MIDEATRKRMEELRLSLLRLHKVLLDDEREAYEKINGPIGSPGRVLSLVMSDPFFDWLHRISQAIVKIDETLEDDEATGERADALFTEARAMVLHKGPETPFMRRYKHILQRNSAAVLAHAEVLKTLFDD
ncbi:MAG: hypothetical protein V4760_05865 [Bdellovibrionota bacterium]